MKFGVALTTRGRDATAETLARVSRAAEKCGFDSVWVTDETIRLLRELWMRDEPQFAGRFFRVEEVRFYPKPVQKPHPPIWIGGHTPAALRRAALLAMAGTPSVSVRPSDCIRKSTRSGREPLGVRVPRTDSGGLTGAIAALRGGDPAGRL